MAGRILELARAGRTEIVGICGGLQILGTEITDPFGIESPAGRDLPGLGLLGVRTTLAREKTLRRVSARHAESGCDISGYEIHHGLTSCDGSPLIRREDGEGLGFGTADGLCCVTSAEIGAPPHVISVTDAAGLATARPDPRRYDLEAGRRRLAMWLRSSMNMDAIYKIMGLKKWVLSFSFCPQPGRLRKKPRRQRRARCLRPARTGKESAFRCANGCRIGSRWSALPEHTGVRAYLPVRPATRNEAQRRIGAFSGAAEMRWNIRIVIPARFGVRVILGGSPHPVRSSAA